MTEPSLRGKAGAVPDLAIASISPPQAPVAAVAPPSFREVFDQEHDFVWRSLVHLGVPAAHADDALQEVFLVVHRRLPEYDVTAPMRGWLWGIARNVSFNQRRAIGREARRRNELMREPAEPFDTSLERAPELKAVREILVSMEEAYRDVLVLSDIEGLTGKEIADALGVKLNTVYSRLRIARQRFTEAHQERGFSEGAGHER